MDRFAGKVLMYFPVPAAQVFATLFGEPDPYGVVEVDGGHGINQ